MQDFRKKKQKKVHWFWHFWVQFIPVVCYSFATKWTLQILICYWRFLFFFAPALHFLFFLSHTRPHPLHSVIFANLSNVFSTFSLSRCRILPNKLPPRACLNCIQIRFSWNRMRAPHFCFCVFIFTFHWFFGWFCGAARMESVSDLKSAWLSSVTVNIISCLFGNAAPGFLQLAVAFLCIIIAPAHFLRADKSRHDVFSDRLPSARNPCNLFSHF